MYLARIVHDADSPMVAERLNDFESESFEQGIAAFQLAPEATSAIRDHYLDAIEASRESLLVLGLSPIGCSLDKD